jgi:hypothetical protein
MKKLNFALIIVFAAGLTFISCKKLISKLFPSFDASVSDIQVAVPAIPFANISGSTGWQTIYYDLDSTIKANTGGIYGAGDVTSITVKSIVINLQNGDQLNNFANFENLKVELSSNSNTTPVTIATAAIPDVTAMTLSMDVSASPDILSYLKGDQINYNISGKVRRATYHELDGLATITVTIK